MSRHDSMVVNFELLLDRIINANKGINSKRLKQVLKGINSNVICIGTGGSYAVGVYCERVLNIYNKAFVGLRYPRDILYMNLSKVKEVCAFTYSGESPSIIKALEECKKYPIRRIIFTHNEEALRKNISLNAHDQVINYSDELPKEKSFISIASTLIPMSILLRYGLSLSYEELEELITRLSNESLQYIKEINIDFSKLLLKDEKPCIEIMAGDSTDTAAHILESNLIETGMAYAILHEKNHYCHGRSVLNYNHHTPVLIYLINGRKNGQDQVLLEEFLPDNYSQIIILDSKYGGILGEFDLVMKAMYLSKKMAEQLGKNLSIVEHSKNIDRIYGYSDEM